MMAALPFVTVWSIRASLILLCAGALSLLLRRSSAASRHLVWSAALIGILLVPFAAAVVPGWTVPMPAAARLSPAVPAAASRRAASRPSTTSDATPEIALPPGPAFALAVSRTLAESSFSPGQVIVAAWFIGALAFFSWLLIGLLRLRQLEQRAVVLGSPSWLSELDAARARLSLTRTVRLRSGAGVPVPVTWGTVDPVVLLPDDADGWTSERRRIVLLHELAHVRRHDCLVQRLARIACAIHWFNPLVWLAARQLAHERERACDELVIAAGTKASDYAAQLLALARPTRASGPTAMATPMARTAIEARLRTILSPRAPRPPRGAFAPVSLVLIVAALVLAVATAQPAASASEPRAATDGRASTSLEQTPAPAPTPVIAPIPVVAPTPHAAPIVAPTPAIAPAPAVTPTAQAAPVVAPQESSSTSAGAGLRAVPDHDRARRRRHEERERQQRFDQTMDQLSRTLQQKLDTLQPLLDNLHVHVELRLRDEHGRRVDPDEIAQAVQGALKDAHLDRLAKEAAAEATANMADTISDAVNDALKNLPDLLDHLSICTDSTPSCPKRQH